MKAALADVGPVLDALADPTRRRVLADLAERGPSTATRLARSLPISRQAVVKHLGRLEAGGLVASRRHGRDVVFRTQPRALKSAARSLAAIAAEWDGRLVRIKELAEGEAHPPRHRR